MALKIVTKTQETVKIIVRQDSSIPENLTDDEWESYQNSLDETFLRLKDEPTRFVVRVSLPYEAQVKIQNSQMSYSDGKPELKIGYIMEELRCSLVGIENPAGSDSFCFKKDEDGFASRQLIAELAQYGLVHQLFAIRSATTARMFTPTKK
jgi:hypothetical protein